MIFCSIDSIKILQENGKSLLFVLLNMSDIDSTKHKLKEEIKAVTYHQMKIEKMNDGYSTKIVFDI